MPASLKFTFFLYIAMTLICCLLFVDIGLSNFCFSFNYMVCTGLSGIW